MYEACKELLEKNRDGLGLITFTIVDSLPKKEPPKPGHTSEAKNTKRLMLEHSGDSTRRRWCEICNKDFLMKNNGLVLITFNTVFFRPKKEPPKPAKRPTFNQKETEFVEPVENVRRRGKFV